MNGNNGNASEPVHFGDAIGFHVFKAGPGVEPSQNCKPEVLRLGRLKSAHFGHSDYLQSVRPSGRAHTRQRDLSKASALEGGSRGGLHNSRLFQKFPHRP